MNELSCYDLNMNPLTHFTQWDSCQKIIIDMSGWDNLVPPMVHFYCNKYPDALSVQSEISDNLLTVDVPNILLELDGALTVYLYISDFYDRMAKKTEYVLQLPIKSKPKPLEYEYINNIPEIKVSDIYQGMLENRDSIINLKNDTNGKFVEVNTLITNLDNKIDSINAQVRTDYQIATKAEVKSYLGI